MLTQSAQLGREREGVFAQSVVKGLLSETIAAAEQLASASIIEREGPHPVQTAHEGRPPGPVAVKEDFGIRVVGSKTMPQLLKLGPKRNVIVDLAVEDDPQLPVRRPHRLHAAAEVDDRQAPVTKVYTGSGIAPQAFGVRAAMRDHLVHLVESPLVTPAREACDSTHFLVLLAFRD